MDGCTQGVVVGGLGTCTHRILRGARAVIQSAPSNVLRTARTTETRSSVHDGAPRSSWPLQHARGHHRMRHCSNSMSQNEAADTPSRVHECCAGGATLGASRAAVQLSRRVCWRAGRVFLLQARGQGTGSAPMSSVAARLHSLACPSHMRPLEAQCVGCV